MTSFRFTRRGHALMIAFLVFGCVCGLVGTILVTSLDPSIPPAVAFFHGACWTITAILTVGTEQRRRAAFLRKQMWGVLIAGGVALIASVYSRRPARPSL